MRIVREVTKLLMFTIIWGLPVLLSWMNSNNKFLWLLTGSLVVTIGMFAHYEDLEKIEKNG